MKNQTYRWTVQLANTKKVKNPKILNLKSKTDNNYVYLPVLINSVAVILHAVTQVQIKFKEMILSRMLSVVMKVTVVEVDNNLKNRSRLTE